jgi:hypothetical protein
MVILHSKCTRALTFESGWKAAANVWSAAAQPAPQANPFTAVTQPAQALPLPQKAAAASATAARAWGTVASSGQPMSGAYGFGGAEIDAAIASSAAALPPGARGPHNKEPQLSRRLGWKQAPPAQILKSNPSSGFISLDDCARALRWGTDF